MKQWKILAVTAVLALAVAPRVWAQEEEEVVHAPDGGTTQHVDGLFITPIANAPFSAKVPIELLHTLPDGTEMHRHFYSLVARDSRGRVYHENHVPLQGNTNAESPVKFFVIIDTTAGTRTTCLPEQRLCRVLGIVRRASAKIPVGTFARGTRTLQREDLGRGSRDSLEVVGTRETTTIKPGVMGNDRPLVVTKEFWYSPQLQVNLEVVRQDPRSGTQTLKVTELNMGEPDGKLFEVPADFKIVDERASAE
jgi:hypothetical protein